MRQCIALRCSSAATLTLNALTHRALVLLSDLCLRVSLSLYCLSPSTVSLSLSLSLYTVSLYCLSTLSLSLSTVSLFLSLSLLSLSLLSLSLSISLSLLRSARSSWIMNEQSSTGAAWTFLSRSSSIRNWSQWVERFARVTARLFNLAPILPLFPLWQTKTQGSQQWNIESPGHFFCTFFRTIKLCYNVPLWTH